MGSIFTNQVTRKNTQQTNKQTNEQIEMDLKRCKAKRGNANAKLRHRLMRLNERIKVVTVEGSTLQQQQYQMNQRCVCTRTHMLSRNWLELLRLWFHFGFIFYCCDRTYDSCVRVYVQELVVVLKVQQEVVYEQNLVYSLLDKWATTAAAAAAKSEHLLVHAQGINSMPKLNK